MQLALFDFDNTLTSCDTYSRFLRRIATPQQLDRAKWTVGPWLLGYRLGLISAHGIRKRATQVAFAGRNAAEIAAHAAAYAAHQLPDMLLPPMLQRLQWHRTQGHAVAVISGSLDLYLQPWCSRYGAELICNRLEVLNGQLSGRYAGVDIGGDKAHHIRKHFDLRRYSRIHAYGDSVEDKPMLALADERWWRGHKIT
jgi:HAD superfamily hydrolase (TIGR01490 family)